MASKRERSVSVHDIYKAIRDSTVDRKELLQCMGLPESTISEFETACIYGENPERSFIDALEHFLETCEEGKEWDSIIYSLKIKGDNETIQKIYKLQPDTPSSEAEETYCAFTIGESSSTNNMTANECQERRVYYEKMKTTATTRYNKSKRNIDQCHNDIHEALDTEHREAIRQIESYKEKMKVRSERLEKDNEDIIEKATEYQQKIEEAILRLKRGDHSGIASLTTIKRDINELKEQKKKTETDLQSYKTDTHKPYNKVNAVDAVQDLQRVLTVTHLSGDIDEDEYVTLSDII